jgi:hypothetical protein
MPPTGDYDPSTDEPLQKLVAAVARDAAAVLAERPQAEIVGIIAESGTTECKRIRTLLEQGTGTELAMESFAGIVPVSALSKILDASFPDDALKWMTDPDRVRQLHIVVCTKEAVRVVSVKRPTPGPDDRSV